MRLLLAALPLCFLSACAEQVSRNQPAAEPVARVHNFDLYVVDDMAVMTYQGPVRSASLAQLETSAAYAFKTATGCNLDQQSVVSDARTVFGNWACTNGAQRLKITNNVARGGAVSRSGLALDLDGEEAALAEDALALE